MQGEALVHEAVVRGLMTFAVDGWVREIAQLADAIVHGHQDDIAPARQLGAVVIIGRPGEQGAAWKPQHHRARALRRLGRDIDVQIEAVFGVARLGEVADVMALGTAVAKRDGLFDSAPGIGRHGRAPAQLAHWRGGEGNAEELLRPVLDQALHGAVVGLHHRS